MANSWFTRNGNTDPNVPANYTKVTGTPSCSGSNKICAIFAFVDSGNVPLIDDPLQQEMILSLDQRGNTTNVKLQA